MINEKIQNMLETIESYEIQEIEKRLNAEMHERMASVYEMYNRKYLAEKSLHFATCYTEEADNIVDIVENLKYQVSNLKELATCMN